MKNLEMLKLAKTDRAWKDSLLYIPGGCQTFSKAPSQHVNGVAPKMLSHGKGCYVWDLDGNRYVDYMMGLGPVILGHADPVVTKAICDSIERGNCLSLPTQLEGHLSRILVELIPCADKVRFGRNGSDATTAAIRVARAFTDKQKIAMCGYHGWQDWYIGSTSRDKGVPENVKELSLTFNYNDIKSLKKLFDSDGKNIAAVILEPVNFDLPENNFLEEVKQVAHSHGSLLIFDEIITGFRLGLGGAQDYFNVTPDLATFGKSIGNGFPLAAVTGKSEIMDMFSEVFFSSTFGGELTGIVAAITTIEELRSRNGVDYIHKYGHSLKSGISKIIANIEASDFMLMKGMDYWPKYEFMSFNGFTNFEIQSLFQQELVKNGVLSRPGMMISLSHTKEAYEMTLESFERAITVVKEAVEDKNVLDRLEGEIISPVMQKR